MAGRFKLQHIAEALRKGAGIPSAAAGLLAPAYGGCTAQTVRNYMARYPQLRQVANEAVEVNLDLAETKLLSAINEGTDWAVKFYLETKGKNRGYTRRQEIAGVPGAPVVVTNARDWIIGELDGMDARIRPEPGGADGEARPGGAPAPHPETVH